jgi:hypothetical protein
MHLFSQPASITYNSVTYTGSDFTIPSYTELCRCYKSNSGIQNAINNLKNKNFPYNVVINLYDDPTTKMAFTWFTNLGVDCGEVQIVQINNQDTTLLFPSVLANCTTDILNYNVANNNLNALADITNNTSKSYVIHKALVTGLTPNTTYLFRVGYTDYWSEIGTFTTAKANKDDFSFIYNTDQQSYTYTMYDFTKATSQIAFNMYPNINFWMYCGDFIQSGETSSDKTGSSEWEWGQFIETQHDIFLKVPFAPIIGNHDNNAAKNFSHHFHTNNPSFDNNSYTPGSVYSFVYGDALFMALNSEACYNWRNLFNTDHEVYTDSLINWMRTQVAKNQEVKWRIVFFHKSFYQGTETNTNSPTYWTEFTQWRDRMTPIFEELEIDLAIEGHDHIYKVIGPMYNKQPILSMVTDQVSNLQKDTWSNVTGKLGGTFNVQTGTLHFLNTSFSENKYTPILLNRDPNTTLEGVSNYSSIYTGRLGQTGSSISGNPCFSHITVTTDTIFIVSHEIFRDGSTQLFFFF